MIKRTMARLFFILVILLTIRNSFSQSNLSQTNFPLVGELRGHTCTYIYKDIQYIAINGDLVNSNFTTQEFVCQDPSQSGRRWSAYLCVFSTPFLSERIPLSSAHSIYFPYPFKNSFSIHQQHHGELLKPCKYNYASPYIGGNLHSHQAGCVLIHRLRR